MSEANENLSINSNFKNIKIVENPTPVDETLVIDACKFLYIITVQIEEKTQLLNILTPSRPSITKLIEAVSSSLKVKTLCILKIDVHEFS
jgi:hypothetical protein